VDLILLRHGETEWNVTGRMQGVTDTRLTEAGLEQAHQALTAMPRFSQVWTSPLQRARITAEIIATSQGLSCSSDERLTERSWGEWEGMLPWEVDRKWPGWRETGKKPPGYENDDSVFGRFREWIKSIPDQESGAPLLAVTHGGFMSAVERVLGGVDTGYKNLEGVWIGNTHGQPLIQRHQEFIPDARKLTR
jgi:broad specificity phosphatase PhoE